MSYQNGMAGGSYYPQQGGMQNFNNLGGGFNNGGFGGRGRGRRGLSLDISALPVLNWT
jgi:hypothetical protein